jgi:hypothetical protein
VSKKVNYPDIRRVRGVREAELLCSRCREWFSDSEFHYSNKSPNVKYRRGRSYHCKACDKFFARRNYGNNAERYRELARKYRKEHPEAGKNRPPQKDMRGYRRDQRLRDTYGISLLDYNRMLEGQNGVCAICRRPETIVRKGKSLPLAVDHCHELGYVRGLFCSECNNGIGKLKDDPNLLLVAAAYLIEHREKNTPSERGMA